MKYPNTSHRKRSLLVSREPNPLDATCFAGRPIHIEDHALQTNALACDLELLVQAGAETGKDGSDGAADDRVVGAGHAEVGDVGGAAR